MDIAIPSKPIDGAFKDSFGVTWKFRVRPVMGATIFEMAGQLGIPETDLATLVSNYRLGRQACNEGGAIIVGAENGSDEPVTVNGKPPTDPSCWPALFDWHIKLAQEIGSVAMAAGARVDGERGNSPSVPD